MYTMNVGISVNAGFLKISETFQGYIPESVSSAQKGLLSPRKWEGMQKPADEHGFSSCTARFSSHHNAAHRRISKIFSGTG